MSTRPTDVEISAPPRGYRGPHDQGRDSRLCVRCGDPIRRLAERVDPAWLGTLDTVDVEALTQLHAYIAQLATLWWWTHWALDGASHGNGIDEVRTHQRGGDPTGNKIRDGQWDEETGEQLVEPQINDKAAAELRARCRKEAKRLRDASQNLQRYLAALELTISPNLEREQRLGLRDENGRLVP